MNRNHLILVLCFLCGVGTGCCTMWTAAVVDEVRTTCRLPCYSMTQTCNGPDPVEVCEALDDEIEAFAAEYQVNAKQRMIGRHWRWVVDESGSTVHPATGQRVAGYGDTVVWDGTRHACKTALTHEARHILLRAHGHDADGDHRNAAIWTALELRRSMCLEGGER